MNEEYKPINNLWKDSEGYRYFGTLKLSSKIKYNGDDFISLWEWVEQLQQERNQFKEYTNHNYDKAKKLQQENQQLKIEISAREEEYKKLGKNWNELKEWLKKELGDRINPNKDKWLTGVYDAYRETIDKMQELERGVSDVED